MNEKLVKEIDSLTYNARSVLNGMIRSTVSSGSDSGYSITRAGIKVTLDRVDIYRLNKFYTEWERNAFSLSDVSATSNNSSIKSFDTIRLEQDNVQVRDDNGNVSSSTATTTALVRHSRLLYLNLSNSSNSELITDFWLSTLKINSQNNSKLISNSAPIPLNLRTPVYDENLATTKYNSHPTYLFPKSYYDLDTLGFQGDEIEHNMGGKSWDIVVDELVNISSPYIMNGTYHTNAKYKTKSDRVGVNSFVWGNDSYATGDASSAGGQSSMAVGKYSVALGYRALASAWSSSAIGRNAFAVNLSSGVFAGQFNQAKGVNSVIMGGIGNVTASVSSDFIMSIEDTEDECLKVLIDCVLSDNNPLRNIIVVNGSVTDKYSIGDSVIIYNYKIDSDQDFHDVDGKAYPSINTTIENVVYDDNKDVTNIVIKEAIGYNGVTGAEISTTKRAQGILGENSFVTGKYNVATGSNQAVVGQYNIARYDANFIVGVGTSSSNRKNAIEIYNEKVLVFGNIDEYPLYDDKSIPLLNKFVGTHTDSVASTLQGANGYIQVNSNRINSNVMVYSNYGIDLDWGDDNRLALSGNTFTTLATNGNSRAHDVSSQSLTDIKNLDYSGFYYVPPNVVDDLNESIGANNGNQDWHLLQNTITGPGSNKYTWQMAKAIRVGSDNSRLSYRSIQKNNDNTVTADEWSTVANTDDVADVQTNLDTYIVDRSNDGIWFDCTGYINQYASQYGEVYPLVQSNVITDDNKYENYRVDYTIIGDTMHYSIYVSYLRIARSTITHIRAFTNLDKKPYVTTLPRRSGFMAEESALHEVWDTDLMARAQPEYQNDRLFFNILFSNSEKVPNNKELIINITGTVRLSR